MILKSLEVRADVIVEETHRMVKFGSHQIGPTRTFAGQIWASTSSRVMLGCILNQSRPNSLEIPGFWLFVSSAALGVRNYFYFWSCFILLIDYIKEFGPVDCSDQPIVDISCLLHFDWFGPKTVWCIFFSIVPKIYVSLY